MIQWLQSLFGGFKPPEPVGPPQKRGRIESSQPPISSLANWEGDELQVVADGADTVRLFDLPLAGEQQCMLGLRFRIKTKDLTLPLYPEMWIRVTGRGEFFSKGLNQKLRGTNDWTQCELPFYLKAGELAELLKFNLVFAGPGTVRIKDIELHATPLKG
jgi:hypothetical protein